MSVSKLVWPATFQEESRKNTSETIYGCNFGWKIQFRCRNWGKLSHLWDFRGATFHCNFSNIGSPRKKNCGKNCGKSGWASAKCFYRAADKKSCSYNFWNIRSPSKKILVRSKTRTVNHFPRRKSKKTLPRPFIDLILHGKSDSGVKIGARN